MPFYLSEQQWEHCCTLISKLDGWGAGDDVRTTVENLLNRAFVCPAVSEQLADALQNASAAAEKFEAALAELISIDNQDIAFTDGPLTEAHQQDIDSTAKLARLVAGFKENFRTELRRRRPDAIKNNRGRPEDTAIMALCMGSLQIARQQRWSSISPTGCTSPAFIDLVLELAEYARHAGLTHVRDRRAVARAMMKAREQHEAEVRAAVRLNAELDAMVSPKPEKAAADPNCLCGSPKKSG